MKKEFKLNYSFPVVDKDNCIPLTEDIYHFVSIEENVLEYSAKQYHNQTHFFPDYVLPIINYTKWKKEEKISYADIEYSINKSSDLNPWNQSRILYKGENPLSFDKLEEFLLATFSKIKAQNIKAQYKYLFNNTPKFESSVNFDLNFNWKISKASLLNENGESPIALEELSLWNNLSNTALKLSVLFNIEDEEAVELSAIFSSPEYFEIFWDGQFSNTEEDFLWADGWHIVYKYDWKSIQNYIDHLIAGAEPSTAEFREDKDELLWSVGTYFELPVSFFIKNDNNQPLAQTVSISRGVALWEELDPFQRAQVAANHRNLGQLRAYFEEGGDPLNITEAEANLLSFIVNPEAGKTKNQAAPKLIKFLVEKGVNPYWQYKGKTLLEQAVYTDKIEMDIINYLIEIGLNPYHVNKAIQSYWDHEELWKLLERTYDEKNTSNKETAELQLEIYQNQLSIISYFNTLEEAQTYLSRLYNRDIVNKPTKEHGLSLQLQNYLICKLSVKASDDCPFFDKDQEVFLNTITHAYSTRMFFEKTTNFLKKLGFEKIHFYEPSNIQSLWDLYKHNSLILSFLPLDEMAQYKTEFFLRDICIIQES